MRERGVLLEGTFEQPVLLSTTSKDGKGNVAPGHTFEGQFIKMYSTHLTTTSVQTLKLNIQTRAALAAALGLHA